MRKIGTGIMIDGNKRTLLIKRSFLKKDHPNLWAFPGGGNENNETMEETAIREVKEEVGLNFFDLELFYENKTSKHNFFRYIGKYIGKVEIQTEECDGYGWFTFEEAKSLPISENMLELLNKLKEKNII